MRLAFADPRNLTLSPLNMHYGRPDPDVSDILPSVRQRGVLLTLLVLETVADGDAIEVRTEPVNDLIEARFVRAARGLA